MRSALMNRSSMMQLSPTTAVVYGQMNNRSE